VKIWKWKLTTFSIYSSVLPKKLPQTAIPKEQQITYSTKLRNQYPKREEPVKFRKELTHQTAEEYVTEQVTNLNPNSKK